MLIKILKSDRTEMEERQIARLKKEIETLTDELQMRELTLEKLKNKDSTVNVVAVASELPIEEIPE
jgi:hypothetical protein